MTSLLEHEILLVAATELELCGQRGIVCGGTGRGRRDDLARACPESAACSGQRRNRRQQGTHPGTVVIGSEAFYCDLGAEIPIVDRVRADMELVAEIQAVLPEAVVLPIATSAYVTGSERATEKFRVEGMEGFGVLRACELAEVPGVEVRVISNDIGEGDRALWMMRRPRSARRGHAAAARRRRRASLIDVDGAGSVHAPRATTSAPAGVANRRAAGRRGDPDLWEKRLEGACRRPPGRAGQRARVGGTRLEPDLRRRGRSTSGDPQLRRRVLDRHRAAVAEQGAVVAYCIGVLVFVPFPLLATLFILPGLIWLSLFGLAVPAALVEGLGVRGSLVRAVRLARVDFVHVLGGLATLAIVVFLTQASLFFVLREFAENTRVAAATLLRSSCRRSCFSGPRSCTSTRPLD